MPDSHIIQAALDQAVSEGVFPGAVLAVRRRGGPGVCFCAGRLSISPPGASVRDSTVYDLASLTKPLATVTSILLLVQEGRSCLNDRIGVLLPELVDSPVEQATMRQLLTHSSGLPGWRGFYERLCPQGTTPATREARADAGRRMLRLIGEEALIYGMGEKSLYSDLGFMLLGILIERLTGMPLDRFVRDRICQPLGAQPLGYLADGDTLSVSERASFGPIAPTEEDPWRGRLLCGEVHDENAAALGGVAGHAGLFGTAEAVLAVTGAWLQACRRAPSLLDAALVLEFVKRQDAVPGSSWALGWDTPSSPSSSGRYFSPHSFGHLGYTGTSVWIDPVCELEVVLLSNRVHPTRTNHAIKTFRPMIHDLVYREFVGNR